jgi:hypothetical protein
MISIVIAVLVTAIIVKVRVIATKSNMHDDECDRTSEGCSICRYSSVASTLRMLHSPFGIQEDVGIRQFLFSDFGNF